MFRTLNRWWQRRKGNATKAIATSEQGIEAVQQPNEPAPSEWVAYDENLLERARTQWQFGDWESLAALSREILQHHPDRAKLALLAAAGHQQQGDMVAARRFTLLAQGWGVSKKLISQVLIAGVHNTLGRAEAINSHQQRAMMHFSMALNTANTTGDKKLLCDERARRELAQLGLTLYSNSLLSTNESLIQATPPIMQITERIEKQNNELKIELKKHQEELSNLKKNLTDSFKKEVINSTNQLEAFLGIQNFFLTGEHLPSMHGWPISPDFALYLIDLINTKNYNIIIEFGSGTSTVLIAKTIQKLSNNHEESKYPIVTYIAFEHLEKYFFQTKTLLQQAKAEKNVTLLLTHLKNYTSPEGLSFKYYDCDNKLKELSRSLNTKYKRILLVVDGPPGSTNKYARYPALPKVTQIFPNCHIDILLDDYIRQEEKDIADMWVTELKSSGREVQTKVNKMEKDSIFITSKVRAKND